MSQRKVKYKFYKYRICNRVGLMSNKIDYIIQWKSIFFPFWFDMKTRVFGVKKTATFDSLNDAQKSVEDTVEKKEILDIFSVN